MRLRFRTAARTAAPLTLLLAVACSAADSPRLRLPTGADHITIPLRPCGGCVAAQVRIDGKDAGWFVLDTGAPRVALDIRAAERLGIAALGTSNAGRKVARFGTIEVGEAKLASSFGVLINMPESSVKGEHDVAGLLGGSFLREAPFTIDFADLALTLHDPATFRAPAGAAGPFPFATESEFLLLRGKIEGYDASFMLDTGLRDEAVVLRPYVTRFPELVRDKPSAPQASAGVNGVMMGRFYPFESLELLGRTWAPIRASVPDDVKAPFGELPVDCAAIAGCAQLRDARVTFDYSARQIWV